MTLPIDHVSMSGIEDDADGFQFVRCECGVMLGPAPGAETILDIAMEHAFRAGVEAASKAAS